MRHRTATVLPSWIGGLPLSSTCHGDGSLFTYFFASFTVRFLRSLSTLLVTLGFTLFLGLPMRKLSDGDDKALSPIMDYGMKPA